MTKPAPCIGMRRHRRVDGGEHLVGRFDTEAAIAVGTEVVLRRDDDGSGYVLQFVPPAATWRPTKAERQRLELANAPRGALRLDARDGQATRTMPEPTSNGADGRGPDGRFRR